MERGLTLHLKFLEPFEIDDHQQVHCPYDQLQVQPPSPTERPLPLPTPLGSSCLSLLLEPLAKGQGRPYKGWVGAHESGSDLRLKTYTKQDSTTTISQVPRLKPRQPCLKNVLTGEITLPPPHQIYANGKNLGEFCGNQRPPDLDTSSNAVDLLFFTDESGDSRGWKLHYTTDSKLPRLELV